MSLGRVFVLAALAFSLGGSLMQPVEESALAEAVPSISELASQTIAQRPNKPAKPEYLKELNLTTDQTKRLEEIQNRYKSQISERTKALQQSQQELRDLMAGTASKSQIQDKFRQVQTLRQQLAESQFNSMLEIREVLTPEQRRKFAALMQNRRQQMRNQRGS